MEGELQRGLQELTVATQLDAQQRHGEAVQAYRSGVALLYLAYGDARQADSFRQMLLGKIGEYQRRADQLALRLEASGASGPAQSHHQPPSQRPTQPVGPSSVPSRAGPTPSGPPPSSQAPPAGLDIPKHALVAFSQLGGSAAAPGGLPSHRFADDEDRALMERVMQLRVDAASAGGGSGGGGVNGGGGAASRSAEDVDREYRERVNRLAGREVIADPAAPRPSVIDVEELTEEEQIERIMNAVHDDVRLEILGGPVAASAASSSSSASSSRDRARPRRGERSRRRQRRHASDSDESSSTGESDDEDDDSDTASSDSDEEEAERRRRRRARMERERDLTFGQKWALRKKEREDRKKGRDGGGGSSSASVPPTDPLREREKAFMARKEKEEQDKERKYRAEFIRKYGNI